MHNGLPPSGPVEREKPRSAAAITKRLVGYFSNCRGLIIGMLVLVAASTLLNLLIPEFISRAIDLLAVPLEGASIDWRHLITILVILLLIFAFSSLFSYLQGRLSAKLTRTATLTIRKQVSEKLIRLPVEFFDSHRSGDITARLTNDIDNIANLISQAVGTALSSAIVIIGCVVIMLIKSPLLAAVCMSTVILNVVCSVLLSRKMFGSFRKQQEAVGEMNSHVEQSVAAKKTIDSYQMTEQYIAENDRLSDKLTRHAVKAQVLGGAIPPLMSIIGNLNFLLIVAVGALMYIHGGFGVTIGMIQAFTLYSRQFTKPINELSGIIAQLMTALASAERVFEIIDASPEEDNGRQTLPEKAACSIRFEHVTFSYVFGVKVLDDFSLAIEPGQRVALVGRTGVGKTTLVNLLMRFYEPDSGRILIDGVDIREIPKAQLRQTVTIVLQNTALLDGTIRDNIAYGRFSADPQTLKRAAEMTYADGFISQQENGMDTEISRENTELSQGERQLLCMARASLTQPRALVLDEAMSSVDSATEEKIQAAMLGMMSDRTCIIIAHRLSTVRNADKIAVVEDGKVAESGKHTQLLEQRGIYYGLYKNKCIEGD
ncbi:MAG: ABC transporter ATP-binding protein [Clostridia bacterium]|nr:ABC transporter ATP-binding protein [Clostridia bacterium]